MSTGLADRVAVLTGATGGMGQLIAAGLLAAGAHVVTIARDPARVAPHHRLEVITGDLSRRRDVLTAARTIADRHDEVHILINNAGAHFPERRVSADGIEMHTALDYLAAYGLMTLLDGPLRRGRGRVVNVASDTLNDTRRVKLRGRPRPATLDLTGVDDLAQVNPAAGFEPFEAYARAKLMTVTAGYARAREGGVTVNALHPGIVATGIIDDLIPGPLRPFRALIRNRLLTPAEGAGTALRIATDPGLAGVTGRYFNRDTETTTPPVSHDLTVQQRLVALSDLHFAR